MDEPWQDALWKLLTAYFGDASRQEGGKAMAFVSRTRPDQHRRYLATLDRGIAAATREDPEVITVIQKSLAHRLLTIADARELLQGIRAEYLSQYEAAVRGAGQTPAKDG